MKKFTLLCLFLALLALAVTPAFAGPACPKNCRKSCCAKEAEEVCAKNCQKAFSKTCDRTCGAGKGKCFCRNAKVDVQKTAAGVVITLTGETEEEIAAIQKCAGDATGCRPMCSAARSCCNAEECCSGSKKGCCAGHMGCPHGRKAA